MEAALGYLAHRPRSRWEVERHLHKKGYQAAVRERVAARLQELGLLDDAAFARAWIENRQRFRPRSELALREELRLRGVDGRVVDEALEGFDAEESAYRALVVSEGRFRSLDPRELRRRCEAYLARRGFDFDVAGRATRRAIRRWEAAGGPGKGSEAGPSAPGREG